MKKILMLMFIMFGMSITYYLNSKGIGIESIVEIKDSFVNIVDRNYIVSVICFILMYTVLTSFAVPSGIIFSLMAGMLFGIVRGTMYINIGATLGGSILFLIVRYLVGKDVQRKYNKQFEKFNREFEENGVLYMLSARLMPVMPYTLINLISGLTKVKLKDFIWTTSIGILPMNIMYVFIGNKLLKNGVVGDIINYKIILFFIILSIIAIVPVIIKKRRRRYERV
ncbi:MAG: TVP38/TMEM64 family protein [Clostridia bacterium]|jgi:uncharacterized membrane protein YdjX (TVP38/TMEM64 family)|nr:TVP38/TMEM64 family protein [Clostridia bacterium]